MNFFIAQLFHSVVAFLDPNNFSASWFFFYHPSEILPGETGHKSPHLTADVDSTSTSASSCCLSISAQLPK